MANIGEKDEILLKLYLIYLRDNREVEFGDLGVITSVGFGNYEYPQWPSQVTLEQLKTRNEGLISELVDYFRLTKAPPKSKSDVYINGYGISLKSLQGAPPALINHTHRKGFANVASRIGENISLLDSLVDEYWDLRLSGKIGEDIGANSINSPFSSDDARDIIKPYLNYFLFTGTGQADSAHPSEYLLDITDVFNISTWHIYDKETAISDAVYNRLLFSLRNKGMSANYPNVKDSNVIKPWTRHCNGSYKGSLHVRFK